MLQRFSGPDGHIHLVEALEVQSIAGGDTAIARAISGCVEVASFQAGSSIIEESAPDNDLYFILAGVVSIRVSGREIAVRTAGQHVGEMALLDHGQPRSASAVADGEVVAARISASGFAALADANPRLWQQDKRTIAAIGAVRTIAQAGGIRISTLLLSFHCLSFYQGSAPIGPPLNIGTSFHQVAEPFLIVKEHSIGQHPAVVVGKHLVGRAVRHQLQTARDCRFIIDPIAGCVLLPEEHRLVACHRKRQGMVCQPFFRKPRIVQPH